MPSRYIVITTVPVVGAVLVSLALALACGRGQEPDRHPEYDAVFTAWVAESGDVAHLQVGIVYKGEPYSHFPVERGPGMPVLTAYATYVVYLKADGGYDAELATEALLAEMGEGEPVKRKIPEGYEPPSVSDLSNDMP